MRVIFKKQGVSTPVDLHWTDFKSLWCGKCNSFQFHYLGYSDEEDNKYARCQKCRLLSQVEIPQ